MPARQGFTGEVPGVEEGNEVTRRAVETVQAKFAAAVVEHVSFRGEETLILEVPGLIDIGRFLKDDPGFRFDYLTDIMAAHFLERSYE